MNTQTTNHAACDTFKRILTVFLLVLTTAAFGQISTPDDEKQQALQNERERRLNDEQLKRLIRFRQTFVDNVQHTQMLLAELAGTAEKHFQLLESLLTNDEGKRIANATEWFMSYRILKENPVVRIEEITHRLKAVTSIQKDLQSDEDAMYIGFLPSAVTQEEVGRYKFWAEDRLERLKKQHNILKEILDKTAGTSDVSQLITLDKANQQYDAKWHRVLRDSEILGR